MAALLHARVGAERTRVLALAEASESLHEIDALGWRASSGALDGATLVREGSRRWIAMHADLERAESPATLRIFEQTERDVANQTAAIATRPRAVLGSSGSALADRLARLERVIEAARDRAEARATRNDRLARLHTLGGGVIALLLVGGLLRAYRRATRAAARLRDRAARAEGEREALALSGRRVRALVEHASDCMLVVDADHVIRYATDSLQTLTGCTSADALGRPVDAVLESTVPAHLRRVVSSAVGTSVVSAETVLRANAGALIPVELRVADRLEDRDVGGLIITVRDVSERHRLERQLRATELRDPGTGLPNRIQFEQWVRDALNAAGDTPRLAAIVLDLTDLQAVNESLGYAAGDHCLAECARRLRDVAGTGGRLARLAGDEFALLVDDVTVPEIAERWARRLLDTLAAPVVLPEGDVPLTASAGVALAAAGGSPADLIRAADTAVHAATRRGVGHIELFSPAMHARARRRLNLRSALALAVERDELTLAYQPIVDLERGETTAVETLLRWTLDGQPVSPADFIPVAEASGLIVALGARVLERACVEVAEFSRSADRPLNVSVNVSAVQLRSPGFVGVVASALERSGLEPYSLVLELTESATLDDMPGVQATIAAVRALGVRIAIDDFGTGYSSLATLAALPVDVLKLDRSFVAAMDESPAHEALLAGVLSMAHRVALPTVVEGVETHEQLDRLIAFGAQYAQGYHLGRPGALATLAPSAAGRAHVTR
ncbi:putative bifunctional diguanylate cyclase/phosphodiesterase [Solirubrobacter soli]|uniref:putative bifunctional diguanylate cyclase/phosphodiesterase n=1 Tax=Solirubrobacter soli TaxID=363832 RepID=UPI000482A64A|nr:GGDEF domain-containing phosphodiesterase [Solirubrobacter soli]